MRKFFRELIARWRSPLNTWWRNAGILFATLGAMAATAAELLPSVLNDDLLNHEMRDCLRYFYSFCSAFALAAKITTGNQAKLDFEKKLMQAQVSKEKANMIPLQKEEPSIELEPEIIGYVAMDSDVWINNRGEDINLDRYEKKNCIRWSTKPKCIKAIFMLKKAKQ